jgi:hypothetical protein
MVTMRAKIQRIVIAEHVGVTVTLWTSIWEVLGLNLCRDTSYPEFFPWFSLVPPGKCQNRDSIRQRALFPNNF